MELVCLGGGLVAVVEIDREEQDRGGGGKDQGADQGDGVHIIEETQMGDAEDLARKVQWAWEHPDEMDAMGRRARQEFEKKYTAERNIELLEEIYQLAMTVRNKPIEVAEHETLPV